MTWFKLATHRVTGRPMVEVWDGDQFIAGIYADNASTRAFRIVSKHRMTAELDKREPNTFNVKIGEQRQ